MAKALLYRIIQEVQRLDLNEQQVLRDQLDEIIKPAGEDRKRAALHQALRDTGLITHTRQPCAADIPDRRLISVQGKPVSETIIKDRR